MKPLENEIYEVEMDALDRAWLSGSQENANEIFAEAEAKIKMIEANMIHAEGRSIDYMDF